MVHCKIRERIRKNFQPLSYLENCTVLFGFFFVPCKKLKFPPPPPSSPLLVSFENPQVLAELRSWCCRCTWALYIGHDTAHRATDEYCTLLFVLCRKEKILQTKAASVNTVVPRMAAFIDRLGVRGPFRCWTPHFGEVNHQNVSANTHHDFSRSPIRMQS